jgi:hypothetical protein
MCEMSAKGEFNDILRLVQKVNAIDEDLEKNIMSIPDDERERIVDRQISRMKKITELLNHKYNAYDSKIDSYRDRKSAIKRQRYSEQQQAEQVKGTIWEE